nr:hypothetical protein CJLB15_00027 [Campylobacter phage CJLB-15]
MVNPLIFSVLSTNYHMLIISMVRSPKSINVQFFYCCS